MKTKWSFRNVASFVAVLLILPVVSCSQAGSDRLYKRAVTGAVAASMASLECWCDPGKCVEKSPKPIPGPADVCRKVAVWPVDNDREDMVWGRLQTGVVKCGQFEVYTLLDTRDAEKMAKEHGRQLKYQDRYDADSLVELGKLIGPKCIVVSRIESDRPSGTAVEATLFSKMLDLKTGRVLWAEISEGKGKVGFSASEWGWRSVVVLAVCGLCVFFVYWANWQSLRFFHFWVVLAAAAGGVFWLLIGRFL